MSRMRCILFSCWTSGGYNIRQAWYVVSTKGPGEIGIIRNMGWSWLVANPGYTRFSKLNFGKAKSGRWSARLGWPERQGMARLSGLGVVDRPQAGQAHGKAEGGGEKSLFRGRKTVCRRDLFT